MLRALANRTFSTRAVNIRIGTTEFTAGPGTPEMTVVIADPSTALSIALNPELAVGDAFMDGQLTIEGGDIYDFLLLAASQMSIHPMNPGLLWRWKRRLDQANDRLRARRNVHHHYDLTLDFYRLFLDGDLQYSCALFETPDATLEQAQVAKKRRLIDKLILRPDQRVLDIGCGWGGLGLSLAGAGGRVTGVTLSTEQHTTARARAVAAGVADRVDFRLQDYRDLDGTFDRIISVGMFEHVGLPNYQEYFDTVARLLTPDGVAVIHAIGRRGPPSRTQPWIAKHVFPGGYIPSLSEVLPAIERSGLWVTDMEVLRLHYAETLKIWRERFLARRAEAVALYDERFCRMWEFYLASSEVGFRTLGHMVFQIQLTRRQDAVPLTRAYLCD
ncbi:cyclopropane-fatty-acyl-phospholipid synthase family protein [uncultured Brevundimonas sp.]|uniref:cyclopropane-fatty-acyl-phospholipid synthase family protein n=1 Tax=uncultured Brevundimonas sp. TaxID=213418 RepID=UPI0030ECD87C|tara:strand:- start:16296 stop:17456 length:1161 start_codon:yes stop_codon:yes gene_type:complete